MAQHVWTFIFFKKKVHESTSFIAITTDVAPTISILFRQCPKTFPRKHAWSIRRLITLPHPQARSTRRITAWLGSRITRPMTAYCRFRKSLTADSCTAGLNRLQVTHTLLPDLWKWLNIVFVPRRLCNTAHHPLANSHVKYFASISKQSSKPFGR